MLLSLSIVRDAQKQAVKSYEHVMLYLGTDNDGTSFTMLNLLTGAK